MQLTICFGYCHILLFLLTLCVYVCGYVFVSVLYAFACVFVAIYTNLDISLCVFLPLHVSGLFSPLWINNAFHSMTLKPQHVKWQNWTLPLLTHLLGAARSFISSLLQSGEGGGGTSAKGLDSIWRCGEGGWRGGGGNWVRWRSKKKEENLLTVKWLPDFYLCLLKGPCLCCCIWDVGWELWQIKARWIEISGSPS